MLHFSGGFFSGEAIAIPCRVTQTHNLKDLYNRIPDDVKREVEKIYKENVVGVTSMGRIVNFAAHYVPCYCRQMLHVGGWKRAISVSREKPV